MKIRQLLAWALLLTAAGNACLAIDGSSWTLFCLAVALLCAAITTLLDLSRISHLEQNLGGAKLRAWDWEMAYRINKERQKETR